MDLGLSNRRALVVGASRGIGLAVASTLLEEGASVVLAARQQEGLDRAAAVLDRHAGRVDRIQVDTTVDSSVLDMAERLAADGENVDILVNAAAAPLDPGSSTGAVNTTDDALRHELETKVLGYLRTARAVAPMMASAGWGRIINVSGLAARSTGSAIGSIRNVAVSALTKNLADELGPSGINVTAVHPGTTVTERMPVLLHDMARARGISEAEAADVLAQGSSIGRLVTAAEVADVVAFLASPRSVAINGDSIPVGGGVPGPIYY